MIGLTPLEPNKVIYLGLAFILKFVVAAAPLLCGAFQSAIGDLADGTPELEVRFLLFKT